MLLGLGESVIYFDTDSCVYEYDDDEAPNGTDKFIPDIGNHLGQRTNELEEDEHIVCFVSSGPKSYAFVTNKGSKVVKLN